MIDLEGFARNHGFTGMGTREHGGRTQYRGTCKCGHADEWNDDKDAAWHSIIEHWQPAVAALRARQVARMAERN
jgi:hypothetical protein